MRMSRRRTIGAQSIAGLPPIHPRNSDTVIGRDRPPIHQSKNDMRILRDIRRAGEVTDLRGITMRTSPPSTALLVLKRWESLRVIAFTCP